MQASIYLSLKSPLACRNLAVAKYFDSSQQADLGGCVFVDAGKHPFSQSTNPLFLFNPFPNRPI